MYLVLSVKCSKVFHKDMIDIDQMQSIPEATVLTIKDMKENPGEHLEELLSHMETNDCEHKGIKVEGFNLAQKNRFNGIKDNFVDIIIAQVKKRFPEKDMQVLKVFNTIPNLAKLPGTGAEIRNHGTKNLERLLERC